ncbi:tail fiber protein [Xenorhabdus sp. KK7.4]|uniref:tail fiber protein n=1 Tax=Xenorhabdus sp. KK7.4 TaxID=1851572 RepID=UPI000C042516|nr:phage tail protein [Xenorhabdus sp. KK7.4]PHM51169.1 tail protein [Xenorhabdus sp. KK7.4]
MNIQDSNSSVVVPTMDDVRKAIKEAIEEHAASRNHPYATLDDRGFVTLSNDVCSDSETHAATSKAIKVANDNANTRLSKDQNGADIPDKAGFVKNLDLSELVYRTIGNGPNQIPDMSFFTSGANWFKMPDGRIIQYGIAWFSRENEGFFYADAHFPIPFPHELSCMLVTLWGVSDPSTALFHLASDMNSNTWAAIPMRRPIKAGELPNIPTKQSVMWLAIGY